MTFDARNPDLERAIIANPRDVDSYLVYADWLIEQGDPRGELVTAQIATERPTATAEDRRAAIAIFARNRDYFLGPLAELVRADAFDWRRGFIEHAKLAAAFAVVVEGEPRATELSEVARALFAHPSARFLVRLSLGDPSPPPPPPRNYWERYIAPAVDSFEGVADEIARAAPPTLRELAIHARTSRVRIETMAPGLQAIYELVARGIFEVGNPVALAQLRHATFAPAHGIGAGMLRDIAGLATPALESLTIEFGERSSTEVTDVLPILRRTDLARLTHLALVGCPCSDPLFGQLAEAPLLAQLTELQLVDGNLSDRGVRAVAREHRAFRHLELFDVTGNKLSGTGQRLIRSLAPQVIV